MLSHHETINSGEVHYRVLEQVDHLTKALDEETSVDVVYGGSYPLPPIALTVALKGVPTGVPMDDLQKTYLEQITANYLSQELLSMTSNTILSTKVIQQRGPTFSQRIRRDLQEDDWIELTANILAMYEEPLDTTVNFGDMVNDAVRYDTAGFVTDLVAGPKRPGNILTGAEGNFFSGVSQATFKLSNAPVSQNDETSDKSHIISMDVDGGNNKLMVISICVGAILCMSIWIGYVVYRVNKSKSKNDATISTMKSKPSRTTEPVARSLEPIKGKRFTRIGASSVQHLKTGKDTSHQTKAVTMSRSPIYVDDKAGVGVAGGMQRPTVNEIRHSGRDTSTHDRNTSRELQNDPTLPRDSQQRSSHTGQASIDYQESVDVRGMAHDPDKRGALASRSNSSPSTRSMRTTGLSTHTRTHVEMSPPSMTVNAAKAGMSSHIRAVEGDSTRTTRTSNKNAGSSIHMRTVAENSTRGKRESAQVGSSSHVRIDESLSAPIGSSHHRTSTPTEATEGTQRGSRSSAPASNKSAHGRTITPPSAHQPPVDSRSSHARLQTPPRSPRAQSSL